MKIAYQSKVELDHFYDDIFEKQVYVRNGIKLKEGDCVFDVGANIGLFTLFVSRHYKNVSVYSFEPAPPLFEILRANAGVYAPSARLFNCGLSNEPKEATFTFYPNSSGMSSFYGNEQEEKETLRAIMLNQLRQGMDGMAEVMEYADEILDERFKHRTFTCRLDTLSNIIRANQIERIALLKVDVQKSELDVLLGLDESDWQKIAQIVLEVHDLGGRLEQMLALLKSHDYQVTVEQDEMYEGSALYNLYALRPTAAISLADGAGGEDALRIRGQQINRQAEKQLEALKGHEQRMRGGAAHMKMMPTDESFGSIAVIGMSGRFPGAGNIGEFWLNLVEGRDAVKALGAEHPLRAKGDVLDGVELFDAALFEMSPREASLMDPQHRLFMMCAWEALEDAGYDPAASAGRIGIFGGKAESQYLLKNVLPHEGYEALDISSQLRILNGSDFLTSYTAYKLNLRGPSINVQAADSTSFVALSLACQSLLLYQCEMALCGGVSLELPSLSGNFDQPGDSSPAESCRAFKTGARGDVRAGGVGIVLLKRLADAVAAGDNIHAVIKGSATTNDGAMHHFSAPNTDGQAEVTGMAQALAGVEPQTVTYIEVSGPASPLRDGVEVEALAQVFRAATEKKSFCAIGSVRTNIGNLDAAAGMASLIKTVLALEHKIIPPSLTHNQPPPLMDFADGPFYAADRCLEWKTDGAPRRAGVSSFGMSGINAHVVLEESPQTEPSGPSRPFHLLLLSANSEGALERATDNLAAHLRAHPEQNLADVAYTLQTGRRRLTHRRMLVCHDAAEGLEALETRNPRRVSTSVQETNHIPVAFMFSGLGNHYVNMASDLYHTEQVFRDEMDHCCELLKPHLGHDLREILYPAAKANSEHTAPANHAADSGGFGIDLRQMLRRGESTDKAAERLNQSLFSQPALFCLEYALARLWMAWGIRPDALIGYSIGEYVAACVAEVFSLEDALRLVAGRARMIQELPGGAMLAVPLSEEAVQPLLNQQLSLSASNGPDISVVGGTIEAIADLQQQLTGQGLACQRLPVTHAFHSQMMTAIRDVFVEMARGIKLNPPKLPYLSNVTGDWITAEQAQDPNYWGAHLCQAVRFADGVQRLWKKPGRILLEVGPGQALCAWAMQQPENGHAAARVALPSLRHSYERQSDVAFLQRTLGKLWLFGAQIDWSAFYQPEQRRRVSLPTYPFDLERHWIEPQQHFNPPPRPPVAPDLMGEGGAGRDMPPDEQTTQRRQLATPYVAPRNELEEKLAQIWEHTLHVEGVGIHDDFFFLGGDSIKATQLITHTKQAFFVAISLRDFFNSPTVADLALMVVQKQAAQTNAEALAQMLEEIKNVTKVEGQSRLKTEEPSK